MSSGL